MTEAELVKVLGEKRAACPDCKVKIGEVHKRGVDIERCPRCGGQAIGCNCIYVICGMDPSKLEEEHPDIYVDGPTREMITAWDATWGARRMVWTGWWPGAAEAAELGFWSIWGPDMKPPQRGWVRVVAGTPGAQPDLNTLYKETVWDPVARRRVLRVMRDEGGA